MAVFRQAEDAVGERVAVVMVVEEPAVEALVLQGGLNFGQVHGFFNSGLEGTPPHPFCVKSG